MKTNSFIWLLPVCGLLLLLSSSFNFKLKELFSSNPKNIHNVKLNVNKNIGVNDAIIVINGRDCHDCMIFVAKSCVFKNKNLSLIYLVQNNISGIEKREIITTIKKYFIENQLTIDENQIFFLPNTDFKQKQNSYPILLLKNQDKEITLIDYEEIWNAMNDPKREFPKN